jgi:hypothetical protein
METREFYLRPENVIHEKNDNYTRELLTFDLIKANLYGMFSIIPILIIYLIPYYFIWQDSINKKEFKRFVDLL